MIELNEVEKQLDLKQMLADTETGISYFASIGQEIPKEAIEMRGMMRRAIAAEERLAEKKPEEGWLIEQTMHNRPFWWTGDGWSNDSLCGVRFARKKDADTMISYIGLQDCFATDHMWYD